MPLMSAYARPSTRQNLRCLFHKRALVILARKENSVVICQQLTNEQLTNELQFVMINLSVISLVRNSVRLPIIAIFYPGKRMITMLERIGQRFGNYSLLDLLAEDGFSKVYLGEHQEAKKPVVIKVLHTH